MSWWDTAGFTNLATQALKNAQKKIDKVLDIEEGDSKTTGKSSKTSQVKRPVSQDAAAKEETDSWNSWNSWLGYKPAKGEEEPGAAGEQSSAHSSWSFSWASGTQEAASDAESATLSSKNIAGSSQSTSAWGSGLKSKQGHEYPTGDNLPAEFEGMLTKEQTHGPELITEESGSAGQSMVGDGGREQTAVKEPVTDISQAKGHEDVQGAFEKSPEETAGLGREEQYSTKEFVPSEVAVDEEEAQCSEKREESESLLVTRDETATAAVPADVTQTLAGSESCEDKQNTESLETIEIASAVSEHYLDNQEPVVLGDNIPSELESEISCSLVLESVLTESDSTETKVASGAFEMDKWEHDSIHRDSSKETLESVDTVISAQGSSADISDESSSVHLSSSEIVQVASTSITSTLSEPVLLSLSTEEDAANHAISQADQALPELDVFSPQSHSSLLSEEQKDRKSPPLDASLEADEGISVLGPHLDSTATLSSNESSETSRMDSSIDTVVDRSQQGEVKNIGTGEDQHRDKNDHLLESLSDTDAISPSASFVKCMIEEAMEDASKLEDSSSDNHSEEKSESSKVDSEFEKSVYSGHESSDDIETTTSSDIEIISTPTPNGEKNVVDLSPLKFSLQKAARSHGTGHHRTDSQSSSSTHSKGEPEQLYADRDSDPEHREDDDFDSAQHPQRLLKNSKNQQEKDVVKKLAEMAEILQARETRLVQLSKDNNDLLETNSILRSQLQQADEAREAEMTDLNALTEEFTRRMGESERKMQAVIKEKESLKQQLQTTQSELASRAADTSLQAVLEEKDEQIAGLMEEGEKLSKQQLQNSNIIKKLRAKEKENEGVLASQKKKVEQQADELSQLKKVLDAKEDMEKKQADAIKQLNAAVQMLEKEQAKMKTEVETADEKIRGLQATLDGSYKEIAELHKNNAAQDSRAQQAALSAEMQVREELKMAMEQENQQNQRQKEALVSQIEDLRLSMARMEKDHNRREEMLKQENSDLQMRLQEDESRSQDLTQSVTSATRPLLRQIENLRTTHSIQTSAWEKVEKNLTDRLSDAQTALAIAQEKERAATEKLTEVTSRCTALEASSAQLRQEKAHLQAQKDSDRRRIDFLEDRKASDLAQLELTKQKLSDEVASLRKDKVFLESQLETERSRLETERQRVSVAEEQIRILERERPRSRGTPSPVPLSRQESTTSSFTERTSTPTFFQQRSEDAESHFMTPPGLKTSLYDSMRQSGATALVENLQAQLKLREGEISQLQVEIQQLEQTRESMARELVNLTNDNEELQEKVEELPKVQENYKALDSRYNALLQMYGEKEEQVQELMLDLQDVKDMYKSQINALMPK